MNRNFNNVDKKNMKHSSINILYYSVIFSWPSCLWQKYGYVYVWSFPQKICNLGQKVEDKFIKLSKIGFPMERFTADFLQFFTKKRQNLAFGQKAEYLPSNPNISGIFLKFPNFLSLKSFGNLWSNSYIHFLVIII